MDKHSLINSLIKKGISKPDAIGNHTLRDIAENVNKSVEILSNCTNSMSYDSEVKKMFSLCFSSQHETLQQKMFGCFLQVISDLANDEIYVDGRNKYSQQIAKDLYKVMKEKFYTHNLPTI